MGRSVVDLLPLIFVSMPQPKSHGLYFSLYGKCSKSVFKNISLSGLSSSPELAFDNIIPKG